MKRKINMNEMITTTGIATELDNEKERIIKEIIQDYEGLKIEAGTLKIGESEWFHIKEIEVFTGDDEWNETDSISIVTDKDKLRLSKKVYMNPVRTKCRVRNEPAVRLHIESELDHHIHKIEISHHKGQIRISEVY